jgi:branched-chain amino acid transport system permease protein
MDQVMQTIIIGLAEGLIFALVALGYTMVYGIIELINFAHGDVFMIGSLIAFFILAPSQAAGGLGIFPITAQTPVPLMIAEILVTLAIVISITALLNVAIERLAYRPLRHAPKVAPLITAIGMSFVLQNVGIIFAGSVQRTTESIFPTTNLLASVGITGFQVTLSQVFVAVVTIPLLVGLTWFVAKTRQGKAMRATAQDPDAAGLMGVDINRTIAITFLIGGALAGAAGVVQILYNNVTVWDLGFRFGLNSFTAAVLGGIGNLRGALLGGLLLGLVESYGASFFGSQWLDVVAFAVLVIVLMFRPTGLLGEALSRARA